MDNVVYGKDRSQRINAALRRKGHCIACQEVTTSYPRAAARSRPMRASRNIIGMSDWGRLELYKLTRLASIVWKRSHESFGGGPGADVVG